MYGILVATTNDDDYDEEKERRKQRVATSLLCKNNMLNFNTKWLGVENIFTKQ